MTQQYIATLTTKTYQCRLKASGECIVSGLHKHLITETPDNGARLERQRELRREIERKLARQCQKRPAVLDWVPV